MEILHGRYYGLDILFYGNNIINGSSTFLKISYGNNLPPQNGLDPIKKLPFQKTLLKHGQSLLNYLMVRKL